MIFLGFLIAITAAVSGSAAFFSIYGLAQIFAASFRSVIIMGIALESAKLATTSYLYRYWDKTRLFLKSYLIVAIIVLMVITSTGVFGFLSSAYQSDTIELKTGIQRIEYLRNEKPKLEERLANIDSQIKSVPDDQVRRKLQLMKGLKDEKAKILTDLDALNTEEQQLSAKKLQNEAKVGPIILIAQALGTSVDQATIYLIYLIMSVFDPLAVALTIAVNVMLKDRENKPDADPKPTTTRSEIIKSIRTFDN